MRPPSSVSNVTSWKVSAAGARASNSTKESKMGRAGGTEVLYRRGVRMLFGGAQINPSPSVRIWRL